MKKRTKRTLGVTRRGVSIFLASSMVMTMFTAFNVNLFAAENIDDYGISEDKHFDYKIKSDIINKSSGSVDIVGVNATYYDYLSDAELYNTRWRQPFQAGTGINGSKNSWYPFNQYNKDLSAYYKASGDRNNGGNNSWRYPLYFGNFCNTFKAYSDNSGNIEGNKHDDTYDGYGWDGSRGWSIVYDNNIAYSPYGWYHVNNTDYNGQWASYDKNMMYAANNANGLITRWGVGNEQESKWGNNYYTVGFPDSYASVQGLVNSKLDAEGDLIVGNSTKAPWFNNEWLHNTKHNNKSIATIVSAKFPFRKEVNGEITKYSFTSKNAKDNVSFQWNGDKPSAVQYGSGTSYGVQDGLKYFMGNTASGYGIFPFNNSSNENLNYGFGVRLDMDFRVPEGGVIGGGSTTKGNNGVALSEGIYLNNGWNKYYAWVWKSGQDGTWLSKSFSEGDVLTPADVNGYDYFIITSINNWDSNPAQTDDLSFTKTDKILVKKGTTLKNNSFTSNGGSIVTSGEEVMFEYAGDDDLWIFIDGELALDLGGSHKESSGTIKFTDGKITAIANDVYTPSNSGSITNAGYVSSKTKVINNFDYNETHEFSIFFMERGLIESNMKMSFTMTPVTNELEVKKSVDTANLNKGIKDKFVTDSGESFDFITEGATSKQKKEATLKDKESEIYGGVFTNGEMITVKESSDTAKGYSYTTSYSVYDKTHSADKTYATGTSAYASSDGKYKGVSFKLGDENASQKISYLATLVNKPDVKDLSVSKAIYKSDGTTLTTDVNDKFDFTIELALNGTDYKPYDLEYCYTNNESIVYTATGGTFKLGQGDTVKFRNLPENVKYRITETPKTGFSVMSVNGVNTDSYTFTDVLDASGTNVAYRNKQSTTDVTLMISKTLDGDDYSGDKFTFVLEGLGEMNLSGSGKTVSKSSSQPVEISQVSGGKVIFTPPANNNILDFTSVGNYRYKITETAGTDTDYIYSGKTILVEVAVTASGKNLIATPAYYEIPADVTITGNTDEAKYSQYFANAYKTAEPVFDNKTRFGSVTVNKKDTLDNPVGNTVFALIKVSAEVSEENPIDDTELDNIIANYSDKILSETTRVEGRNAFAEFKNLKIFEDGNGQFNAEGEWVATSDNYITGTATPQMYCLFEYAPAEGYMPTGVKYYFTLPREGVYDTNFDYVDGAIVVPNASGDGVKGFVVAGMAIIFASALLGGSYVLYDRRERKKHIAKHGR